MVYMQQRHLQQVSHRDIHIWLYKILFRLFCIWTSYVSLSDYKVLILKIYTVPVRLHGVTNFFKPESTFKQTRVDFFTAKIWRHISITSQLR